jgi:hypothetical protein
MWKPVAGLMSASPSPYISGSHADSWPVGSWIWQSRRRLVVRVIVFWT